MNAHPHIVYRSWEDVEKLSHSLSEKIKRAGFVPDMLIGIAIGGLVPLTLLARDLGVRNVTTITARSYDAQEQKELIITHIPNVDLTAKNVLLVDEIADSGKTQKVLAELLVRDYGVREVKTATFIINALHCTARPDFYVEETEFWTHFPWEEPVG